MSVTPGAVDAPLEGLRVLIVIDRVEDVGGAEGSTALILRGLHRHGVPVGAVGLDGVTLTDRAQLEQEGVQFFTPSRSGLPSEIRCVVGAVKRFRPTLIHSTLARSDLAARAAGRITGTPVLTSIVNVPYGKEAFGLAPSPRKLEAYRRLDAFTSRYGTFRFHAISQAAADEAVRALGIPAEHIRVVPRGRSAATLGRKTMERRATVRSALQIPQDDLVLVNIAREDVQKGQACLVATMVEANNRCERSVHLVGAGRRGTASDELDRRYAESGVGPLVHRLGVRTDVPDLLAAGDVFVFPSFHEGLGGALLEALALEIPVVAYDDPAVREAVGDAGLLVPMKDEGAFEAAVIGLLLDPEARASLAAIGRTRFEERFENERSLASMLELYANVWSEVQQSYRDPFRSLRFRRRSS